MIKTPKQFDPTEVFFYYQREYLALCETAPVIVVEKSRRVGISWADAADSCLTAAASKEAKGMDCFYIGYNKDMAREYIEAVKDWALEFNDIAAKIEESIFQDENKDITVFRIRFASGFKVEALSSRPSNLRGKQGKVTIDEAAFHADLHGLVKAAIALLMWGGRVVIISTHFGEDNPFNEIVQDTRSGRTGYKLLRIPLQDALTQGLYRRIASRKGIPWTPEGQQEWADNLYKYYGANATEELDVIPTGGTEIYLPRVLIERAMTNHAPILRLRLEDSFMLLSEAERQKQINDWCEAHLRPLVAKLDPNRIHFGGEDFARKNDLSDFWIASEERNLGLRTELCVELRNVPFDAQRQILFYLFDRVPRFVKMLMDARGNGQYLAEAAQLRYGQNIIEAVMLSQPWYRENMPKFRAAFEDGTLTGLPKDSDLMADLRAIKSIRGVPKVPDDAKYKGADGYDRHGDAGIGLALCVIASKQQIEHFGYYPVSNSRHRHDRYRDDFTSHNPNWRSARF